jgi:RNA polymerase sigma-70 factor (ECF subfamily)
MDAIASGDSNALRALYDRHSPLVFATCVRMLRDRNEAEDLLIDIFHEVWQKSSRYDASRGSPVTYLMTLTRSRAIDRQRARPKLRMSDIDNSDVSGGATPDAPVLADEMRVAVVGALQKLELAQRQAIECAYYDGLSHSEIAEKLNKPLGTIKTYIRQGLIRLRESLRNTDGAADMNRSSS